MLLKLIFATKQRPKAFLTSKNKAEVQYNTVMPGLNMSILISLTSKGFKAF
jgi:hypothetical protein